MADNPSNCYGLRMREIAEALERLVRRGVITLDPEEARTCCGMERDADGFCVHRPHHPVYIGLLK